jgi:restriction system protein
MRPLLEACEIGKEHNASEMVRKLAPRFSLTQEDLSKRHDKSKSLIFQGRIGRAKVYLRKAGLLESKSRGYFSINDEGVQFLKTHNEVHNESLCSLAKFREWKYPEKESILLNETPRMDLTIVLITH